MKARELFFIALIGGALAAAYWLGRRSVQVETRETVRIDTLFYRLPTPEPPARRTVTVNVPRVLFAPAVRRMQGMEADTQTDDRVARTGQNVQEAGTGAQGSVAQMPGAGQPDRIAAPTEQDSVRMELVIETKQYADSTYRAQVSGPAIGTYWPQIDWIEIYARERTRTSLVRKPYSWEVGPAAGAWLSSHESAVWVGAQARRNIGRFSIAATGAWVIGGGVCAQVQVGITVWRK